jgi:hypothetical protein
MLSDAFMLLLQLFVLYNNEFCIMFGFLVASTLTNDWGHLKIKPFQDLLATHAESLRGKNLAEKWSGSFNNVDTLTRL